jgi:hypothetical protein
MKKLIVLMPGLTVTGLRLEARCRSLHVRENNQLQHKEDR